MTKEIGYLEINQNPPGTFTIDQSTSGEGWTMPLNGFFVNEQILDLAGLSQQEKTVFFSGIAAQDWGNPIIFNQAAGDTIEVVDVISSYSFNLQQLLDIALYGNFSQSLSALPRPNFEQTVYLNRDVYTVDLDTAAWGGMIKISSNQVGSLQPTAVDRLHIYRTVSVGTPCAASQITVLPVRFVLGAEPKEEKEYQYIMRLKKNLDLQQSFDVDGNRPH